jgi:hypothetical protein
VMFGQRNAARSRGSSRAWQLFDEAKHLALYWNATAAERTAEYPYYQLRPEPPRALHARRRGRFVA